MPGGGLELPRRRTASVLVLPRVPSRVGSPCEVIGRTSDLANAWAGGGTWRSKTRWSGRGGRMHADVTTLVPLDCARTDS